VEADPPPDPGTNNVWTIRRLQPGQHGQIKVKVRTVKLTLEAEVTGSASGTGYASVNRLFSTEQSGYLVTNRVTLSARNISLSGTANTAVKPVEGSKISFSERGSGLYSSEERLSYSPSRILMQRRLNASLAPANISILPFVYNGSWYASHLSEDPAKDTLLGEGYLYGSWLELDALAEVGKTKSTLHSSSRFSGLANYEAMWKDTSSWQRFAGNFTVISQESTGEARRSKTYEKREMGCLDEA
jgi:hypothetical protein